MMIFNLFVVLYTAWCFLPTIQAASLVREHCIAKDAVNSIRCLSIVRFVICPAEGQDEIEQLVVPGTRCEGRCIVADKESAPFTPICSAPIAIYSLSAVSTTASPSRPPLSSLVPTTTIATTNLQSTTTRSVLSSSALLSTTATVPTAIASSTSEAHSAAPGTGPIRNIGLTLLAAFILAINLYTGA